MDIIQPGIATKEAFQNMASGDPEKFLVFFQRARKLFPKDVAEACLAHLGGKGLDLVGRKMASWLAAEVNYLKILVESNLPEETAANAAVAVAKIDSHFAAKLLKEADQLSAAPRILRALSMVPDSGSSLLLPWLGKLSQHSHERVRSRAVKLLCKFTLDVVQTQQQLKDANPRVRANAIEGLWNVKEQEAIRVFRSALTDTNNRVIGNALVGLYMHGEPDALDKMVDLSKSQEPTLRRSIAWCFGHIRDKRAIPSLQALSKDSSLVVRTRAQRSLSAIEADIKPDQPVAA